MECGQFVGKVKPETWWVNPWDFQNLPPREEQRERLMMIRFGGGNPVFFSDFFGWNLFFFWGGRTKYGMKKFRLMVWNPPVFYMARVFTILSSKSPGIRNPSNVRIVQI